MYNTTNWLNKSNFIFSSKLNVNFNVLKDLLKNVFTGQGCPTILSAEE